MPHISVKLWPGNSEEQKRCLLLEGGGHINGGFLQAGLVDEVRVLIRPQALTADIPAVFDGVKPATKKAVPLKLKSVQRRPHGTLWPQYQVRHTNKRKRK